VGIEQLSRPIVTIYGTGSNWYNKGETEMLSIHGNETIQAITKLNSTLVEIANKIQGDSMYQINGSTYFDDVTNAGADCNVLLELLKANFRGEERDTSSRLAHDRAKAILNPPQ
jgi:hypothetical protein